MLCWFTGYHEALRFNIWVWFVCRCARSGLGGLPAFQQESVCLCSVCIYPTHAECFQDLPTRQRYKRLPLNSIPAPSAVFLFFSFSFYTPIHSDHFFLMTSCFFSLELGHLGMVSSLSFSPCVTFSPYGRPDWWRESFYFLLAPTFVKWSAVCKISRLECYPDRKRKHWLWLGLLFMPWDICICRKL